MPHSFHGQDWGPAGKRKKKTRKKKKKKKPQYALYGLNWSECMLRLAVQLVLPATVRSSTSSPPVLQLTSHQEQFTLTYQWRP